MPDRPAVLTLHAVDTAAEEGVVADAAVLLELDCRPLQVVTAVLAAGTRAHALEELSPALLAQQFEAALELDRPLSVRVGLLRSPAQARLVAELLRTYHLDGLVLAPPLKVARTEVQDAATRDAIAVHLVPLARVTVVRVADLPAAAGNGAPGLDALRAAAAAVRAQGARAVLVSGAASHGRLLDLLDEEGSEAILDTGRVAAPWVPGLAGAHAAALAAHLAHGLPLLRAAEAAQRYVGQRLQRGR